MDIVSRESWGAKFAAGSGSRSTPTAEAWLHHTVTKQLSESATPKAEAEQMRVIEEIGQQRFKAGFSYNLAVFPSGRIYAGCGVRRVGTHTQGRNTRALGVVLVGNYESSPVPAPMRQALVDLLRFGKAEGWIDQAKFDGGHRDLKSTSCPGINAYRLIPAINQEALDPRTPKPPLTLTPGTTGGKMYIVFRDAGLDWRSDGIVRAPFDSQEAKNAWVNDMRTLGGVTVVRKTLTPEQIERLVPVGFDSAADPVSADPNADMA